MVTKRTLSIPLVLTGIALLAGCGPPPREREVETISVFAETLVDESSNGSPGGGSTDYTGLQALGAPDVTGCGDDPNAWSPLVANPDPPGAFTIDDWIVVELPYYMFIREVKIYESYNPGAVVAVDMERSDNDDTLVMFEDQYGDGVGAGCPSSFDIQVEENGGVTGDQWNRVAVYLDNSIIGDGNGNMNPNDDWPEIDAIEVIGDILVED